MRNQGAGDGPGSGGIGGGPAAVERFALLASAIAGRSLAVAAGETGAPGWTDGRTIYVDAQAPRHAQLERIAVQACLVGAGSLEPAILAGLVRRPSANRRYLAIEGHRALAAHREILPAPLRSVLDGTMAERSESAETSLSIALGREEIGDPPDAFGEIRPRHVRVPEAEVGSAAQGLVPDHVPRREREEMLRELDDDVGDAPSVDLFSSPVGGGGPIGRLLKRMLADARSEGTGPPGADAPTRFTGRSARRSRQATTTRAGAGALGDVPLGRPRKFVYPEWDVHRRRYRPQWCTVVEVEPEADAPSRLALPDSHALRRPLARLGTDLERRHRQLQGEDVDLDAAVESWVERAAGSAPDEAVYIESQRRRRDLAVLVLLDVSGSAGEPSAAGGTVHVHQRAAAAALTVALHDVGDRVALYGFRSQGRSSVHVVAVKRFADGLDALTGGRLGSLVPGGFTRLGAAIRHGTSALDAGGGTGRRLLVVVSDGFAYDHGYERAYGEADARRALSEARRRGIGCLCLSIGAATDAAALRRVFGTAAHATIGREEQLAGVIGPLFRAALGTADLQRRRSQRSLRATGRLEIERRSA